jgi:NAD(P)-dependent dehydrogenase (short-subunit alcohol dehydrogenase family)
VKREQGRLAGETALITGGTSSLGMVIAQECARQGATVAILGRSEERGKAVVEAIRGDGGEAEFFAVDLRDFDGTGEVVRQVREQLGDLSIVVNGAKGNDAAKTGSTLAVDDPTAPAAWRTGDGTVVDAGGSVWEELFAINVYAPAAICRAAIPIMIERGGGSIVNISSRAAERGTPSLVVYGASKAAVHGLTRSIAVDFGKDGIRCNAIAIGYVMHLDRDAEIDEARRAFFEAQHLTPRLGEPDDVAYAVVYLASKESGFVTGEVLFLDGGGASSRGRVVG